MSRPDGSYLRLDGDAQESPVSYFQPPYHGDGDLGSPEIEMREEIRPRHPRTGKPLHSSESSGTLFPSYDQIKGPIVTESQSFLDDPINKLDTTSYTFAHTPYKDNTGRQLRHILIGSSARWLITLCLCGSYVLATDVWAKKDVVDEFSKRMYNTISTGISIALGLNVASAFKDMTLNMRWPILGFRKRNLDEMDLILGADSLTKLMKLAWVSKKPLVMFVSIAWLLVNIAAQATIAMISLTYSFNTATNAVILTQGNVSVPLLDHFYPLQDLGNTSKPTLQDEKYLAHLYGSLAFNFGADTISNKPKAGDLFLYSSAMLWYDQDNNNTQLIFSDTSSANNSQNLNSGALSVYTTRTINITYTCDSHRVTAVNQTGNGTAYTITVEDVGTVFISTMVENSTVYFTDPNNTCLDNENRCTVIEAYESTDDSPYYYRCEVTLGQTFNDTRNISYISDDMAKLATGSIAQVGYAQAREQQAQIYPQENYWGEPNYGDDSEMGLSIGLFALGSIAGATYYNPATSAWGLNPTAGFVLQIGHPTLFLFSIWIIPVFQFICIVIVAIFANRVKVGPDAHLGMSLLLRPIADALEGVSSGKENSAFRDAKKRTNVKYEKAVHGRWIFKMS